MIQKKSLKEAIQNPEIISVVGELLPAYLVYKGEDKTIQDLNSITENCIIYIGSTSDGWTNIPEGVSSVGFVETILLANASRIMQRYTDVSYSAGGIYVRFKGSTGWSSWGKI